jgi:toluene monooxygenase system protein A
VAIAARHMLDELILAADPIELAIGTNVVFETGFTNLEFVGLAAAAHGAGDRLFERLVTSIQSDEARHAQIGEAVLRVVVAHDKARAQYLIDKWFWRSWRLFAIVSGFSMDYFTPLEKRARSFREYVEEWIVRQFQRTLDAVGLARPWYWSEFVSSMGYYHHQCYASAYAYRSSLWFDMVVPSPDERAWLLQKYPDSWDALDPVWSQIVDTWEKTDLHNDLGVHGTAIIGFCELCQLTLSGGTPGHNSATVLDHEGRRYIFCSAPCRFIFEAEPERYARHKGVVARVLSGEAPANLLALLKYFGLSYEGWGKDAHGGGYPWLTRPPRP